MSFFPFSLFNLQLTFDNANNLIKIVHVHTLPDCIRFYFLPIPNLIILRINNRRNVAVTKAAQIPVIVITLHEQLLLEHCEPVPFRRFVLSKFAPVR